MTEPSAGQQSAPPKLWVRLYGQWMVRLEQALVLVFLAVTVGGATLDLLRVFDDSTAVQAVVFGAAFYLCLFGAVIATRRSNHIAIDAITPRLNETKKRWIEGVLHILSAGLAIGLTVLAYRFVFVEMPAEAEFLKGEKDWFWNRRLWYSPTVVAFGWIALHFLVMGAIWLSGKSLQEIGLAPESDSGHETLAEEGV